MEGYRIGKGGGGAMGGASKARQEVAWTKEGKIGREPENVKIGVRGRRAAGARRGERRCGGGGEGATGSGAEKSRIGERGREVGEQREEEEKKGAEN